MVVVATILRRPDKVTFVVLVKLLALLLGKLDVDVDVDVDGGGVLLLES